MKTISTIISINILSIIIYFNHYTIYFVLTLLLISTLLAIYAFIQTYKLEKCNSEYKQALKMVSKYVTERGIMTSELLLK